MAVAETAEMAVRLSLDSSRFSQSINRIDRRLGAFSGAINRNLGRAVDSVVSKGINLAFDAVRGGLDNLAQLETATTQVTGAIKTMGKQGQVSADQIAGWAVQIETAVQSAFDDKAITAATSTLIRYGNIATENIKPAMVVMTDLAARTGDVGSASKLLAKALADPTKAAGALRKAGVVLTAAQDKQIKSLVKQGKLTKAQSLLLDVLSKRTKGAAAAMNGPAVDAQKELGDAWEEATKALATGLLPVITRFNTFLKDKLSDPTVIANIKKIGDGIGKAADQALTFAQSIPWDKVANGLHMAADFAGKLIGVFTSLPPEAQGAIIALAGLNKLSGGAVTKVAGNFVGGIAGLVGKALGSGIKKIFAAEVTVVGANVTGGGAGGLASVGEVAAGAGLATVFVAGMSAAVFAGLGVALVSSMQRTDTPFAKDSSGNIKPGQVFDLQHGFGRPPSRQASGPTVGGRDMDKDLRTAAQALTVLETHGINLQAIAGARLLALGETEKSVKGNIATLKDRLAAVVKQEGAATRAGDTRHASALASKESAIRGQLGAANAKLAAIRAKKTSFHVTVPVTTNVSVSAINNTQKVHKAFTSMGVTVGAR